MDVNLDLDELVRREMYSSLHSTNNHYDFGSSSNSTNSINSFGSTQNTNLNLTGSLSNMIKTNSGNNTVHNVSFPIVSLSNEDVSLILNEISVVPNNNDTSSNNTTPFSICNGINLSENSQSGNCQIQNQNISLSSSSTSNKSASVSNSQSVFTPSVSSFSNTTSRLSECMSVTPNVLSETITRSHVDRTLIIKLLVSLIHAFKCLLSKNLARQENGSPCTLELCKAMQRILKHSYMCEAGRNCPIKHCSVSKQFVLHVSRCTRSTCTLCLPFRQVKTNLSKVFGINVNSSSLNNQYGLQNHLSTTNELYQSRGASTSTISCVPSTSKNLVNDCNESVSSVNNTNTISRNNSNPPIIDLTDDNNTPAETQEWQKGLNKDCRMVFVRRITDLFLYEANNSTSSNSKIVDEKIKRNINSYALKLEDDIYRAANSKDQYYQLIAEKYFKINNELNEKKRKKYDMQQQLQQVIREYPDRDSVLAVDPLQSSSVQFPSLPTTQYISPMITLGNAGNTSSSSTIVSNNNLNSARQHIIQQQKPQVSNAQQSSTMRNFLSIPQQPSVTLPQITLPTQFSSQQQSSQQPSIGRNFLPPSYNNAGSLVTSADILNNRCASSSQLRQDPVLYPFSSSSVPYPIVPSVTIYPFTSNSTSQSSLSLSNLASANQYLNGDSSQGIRSTVRCSQARIVNPLLSTRSSVTAASSAQVATVSTTSKRKQENIDSDDDGSNYCGNKCVICFEESINSVLYKCGHMCMCYECAVTLQENSGKCPICRQRMQDVIKTYRC